MTDGNENNPIDNVLVKDDSPNIETEGKDNKRRPGTGGRDLQVSALVHLMGLPTKDDYKVLEKKVDLLSNKLTSLAVKVDRVLTEISQSEIIGAIERVDLQISDLRAVIKKYLPKTSSHEGDATISETGSSSSIPKVK
ncbi:MAG: hypothetical protein IT292_05145 [Deltaproteobacteria bacterium]|nr:hypothetical protein [Deltaproteobacteria bacterium]